MEIKHNVFWIENVGKTNFCSLFKIKFIFSA